MSKFLPIVLLAALAFPAGAYAANGTGIVPAASKRHVQSNVAAEPQGQIACGKYGCTRIPPNCHPQQTFDRWGNPTGYDAVVCR